MFVPNEIRGYARIIVRTLYRVMTKLRWSLREGSVKHLKFVYGQSTVERKKDIK